MLNESTAPAGRCGAFRSARCMLKLSPERGRRDEAAEFAFDKLSESDRRAILQIRADDLHADRQTFVAAADWHCGRRHSRQRRYAGPHGLICVEDLRAIDRYAPVAHVAVVVR